MTNTGSTRHGDGTTGSVPLRARSRSLLMVRLRAATRGEHAAVERHLELPRTHAELRDLLGALLAAWHPLERGLATLPDWADVGLDAHLGEASHLLHADLRALGGAAPSPVPATDTTEFRTLAAGMGGRYVLLGSALGGQIIAPRIEDALGLDPGQATSFFRRDDQDTHRDWRSFQRAARHFQRGQDIATAIRAAKLTFAAIQHAVLHRPGCDGEVETKIVCSSSALSRP